MLTKLIVCFIAGIGAGLGTGFAGMSAAAVISPMLITFLDFPAYEAVGIALASDVLASAVSAYTYGKNENLDIKNGIVMMASVLCFTLVGSWAASHMMICGVPDLWCLGFCVLFTFLWARIAARFANKASAATLNRATGIVLVVLGAAIMIVGR